jgi:hypothetical protein
MKNLKTTILIITTVISFQTFGQTKVEKKESINPKEEVGITHNKILTFVMKSEEVLKVIENKEYYSKNIYEASKLISNAFLRLCPNMIYCIDNSPGPYNPYNDLSLLLSKTNKDDMQRELIKIGKISLTSEKYLLEISKSKIKELNKLILKISSDNTISKKEKIKLYQSISVAKYTPIYWSKFKKENTNNDAMRKIDWDKAGVMDTIGALGGPETAAVGSVASIICDLLF